MKHELESDSDNLGWGVGRVSCGGLVNLIFDLIDKGLERLIAVVGSNQKFETLIYQVEDAVDYASAGDTPYTPALVVGIAFQLVFQTGLFNDN